MPDTDTWNMTVHLSGPAAFDRIEVRRALEILVERRHCHELRGLPSGRSRIIEGDNLDAAVELVGTLADDRGVYITLNPVRPDLGDHAAKVADILTRRWFLVDCDPVKSDPDGSSTEAEREEAGRLCDAVGRDLSARGWPEPILISSGNGWHLLYRIDLPNDKLSQQWLAACLKRLAEAHDTDGAKVDRKVHNASRITKLPGTWARKGPNTDARPHRMAVIESAPGRMNTVPTELISALAGLSRTQGTPTILRPDPWGMKVGANGDQSAYARAALEGEVGKVAGALAGERNDQLNISACKLGGYVSGGYLDRSEVERQLAAAARGCGLTEQETIATIRSGLDAGEATPKAVPTKPGKAAPKPEPPKGRLTIRGSEVVPRKVEWLWPDRVPIGFLTVFAGRTGVGKSFVTCHMAASITRGTELPGGYSLNGEIGAVLIISEDPHDTMLAPRLIEMGADMDEVYFMTWEAMASYALEDTAMLERAAMEGGKLPRVIVIDPPTNFLMDKDEHKNAEVRQTLMHLVAWLQDKPVACILILHVNKQTGKGIEAINRVMGSVAWVSTSRIAHVFAPDPEDSDRCLFVCPKNNLGPVPKGLAYRIAKTDTLAQVEWLGEVDTTADEAMGGGKRTPRHVVASEWLIERFRQRLEWPSDELFRAAKEEGISRNAVFEAKKTLDLPPCRQHVGPDGNRHFIWWVPSDWPALDAAERDNGTVGQCADKSTQDQDRKDVRTVPLHCPGPETGSGDAPVRTIPLAHCPSVSEVGQDRTLTETRREPF